MSDMHKQQSQAERKADLSKRDAETQLALGLFVIIIALPVLAGTFWADRIHAAVVNVIAGLVLMGVGVGLAYFGARARARMKAALRDKQ